LFPRQRGEVDHRDSCSPLKLIVPSGFTNLLPLCRLRALVPRPLPRCTPSLQVAPHCVLEFLGPDTPASANRPMRLLTLTRVLVVHRHEVLDIARPSPGRILESPALDQG